MEIYLRALNTDDYKFTFLWRNDIQITSTLGGNTYFVSEEREKKWVEDHMLNDRKNLYLIICLKLDKTPIGMVSLTNIDHLNRKAEFAIQVGNKEFQSKGIGKAATKLMLQHGFNQLNLNKIYLTVLQSNERAIKLYESLNFSCDGILRDELFKNGKYYDLITMSILKLQFDV